jgi:hypothetical protein
MSDRIDRAIAKSILAAEGAAIGGAIGGPVGATVGAVGGLIVGDATTVFPLDMIAIPAYQAYLLSGTPALQVYIRAGETLLPTGGNVEDVQQVEEQMIISEKKPRKRRSKNPWIVFNKNYSYRAKRKNESSQEYLRKRTKAARAAYNKQKRGGK